MIPGMGAMPNVSAGASSGNGDSVFDAGANFGGLNINKGIPLWAVGLTAIAVLGGALWIAKNA